MQRIGPQESSEPFQRFYTSVTYVVAIVVIAASVLATTVAPAAAQDVDVCEGGALVRHLMVVDQANTDPVTLDTAMSEADAIWEDASVRLVWLPAGARLTRPDAYVVVRGYRQAPVKEEAALVGAGRNRELGWVRFESDGRRANLVEASLPAIKSAVQNAWFGHRRFRFHPPALQLHLLGRALGRVIAHEIGHWLVGLGHAEDGLMKAVLRQDDLIRAKAPRLPAAWRDVSRGRLAALRGLCE